VANLVFNLNNPQDDDPKVLSSSISTIGNMAYFLKKFQRSKYMKESATFNLIYLMAEMKNEEDGLHLVMKSSEAIRKATFCRDYELLDAFVAAGLIEAIAKILLDFG
jgi:hypothetical protein